MRFDLVHISASLETVNLLWAYLLLLLHGPDEQRTKTDWKQTNRFRRHALQRSSTVQEEAPIGNSVFSQYTQRLSGHSVLL